jgi:20S proteasome alpha/beta subunit
VTVVLALRCTDGVVMASDSQITDAGRGLSYPAQKLHPLGDRAAWGGSGARAVLGEVQAAFDRSAGAILDAEDIGRELQERIVPIQRHHYEHYIEHVPGKDASGGPAAYVLAAGYDDGPWIVEVDPHGMVSHHEDIGFHAIGSGAPMAQQAGVLLSHFRMTERSTSYGVLAVVRVLDALAVTSPSVGGPVDVCVLGPDGARALDEGEVDDARTLVERWEQREQEVLDGLLEGD